MSKTYTSAHYHHIHGVDEHHFWFRARNKLISSLVSGVVPKGSTFLEVGCGTGIVLRVLSELGYRVSGLDVNARGLALAKERVNAPFFRSSIFSFRSSRRYNAIGAFDVMEHISNDDAFLLAVKRLLTPSGVLFLTVPAGMYLWSDVDVHSGHVRRYEKQQLQQLVSDAGFRISYIGYWNAILLPIYVLWRWFGTLIHDQSIKRYVTTPVPFLNALCYGLLSRERVGLLPFGATLVVVAKRL